MEIYKKYSRKIYSDLAIISILFLFFFQLVSDFLESIYALNLIEVELNENILALLFLLTPIVLLFFKRGFPNIGFIITGEVMVICRILQPLLGVQLKMIVTGIGLGCFMIFFPVFLQIRGKGDFEKNGLRLGIGLVIAVLLSITLRVLGSSIDISMGSGLISAPWIINLGVLIGTESLRGWFMWIGWIFAIYLAITIPHINTKVQKEIVTENSNVSITKPGSKWKILGLTIAMMGIITLLYFTFTSPTVIARWTEVDYLLILVLFLAPNALFLYIQLYKPEILKNINRWMLILWNVIFIFSLVITLLNNSIFFAFVNSYPYFVESNILNLPFLIIMLILSPIIFIDFIALSQELFRIHPSTRKLGGSYFIASGFFLIMVLSAVFTIVWDYIPLVGDFFRDMIWLVYLVLGLSFFLPFLLLFKRNRLFKEKINSVLTNRKKIMNIASILVIVSVVSSLIFEFDIIGHPISGVSLSIVSYNIQQGSDASANKNFEGQFEVIRNLNGDIIGLQESDTCRISSGNIDIVRYINNRLKYYSYYGPKTVTGTFGIALLSKYPIRNPQTFYMESKGEQTATIWAQIEYGLTIFNVFVTHLGNYEDPSIDRSQIVQQENILSVIAGLDHVILMGDFNFQPNTEQYNITVAELCDCWESAPVSERTIGDVPASWVPRLPDERIDHIFVSEDLNNTVTEVLYTGGSAADHPCVYVSLLGIF